MMLLNSNKTFAVNINNIGTIRAYENKQCLSPREVVLEVNGIVIESIKLDFNDTLETYEEIQEDFDNRVNEVLNNFRELISIISCMNNQESLIYKLYDTEFISIELEDNKYYLNMYNKPITSTDESGRIIII